MQWKWNEMEQKLIEVTNTVAPLVEFTENQATSIIKTSSHIKRKMKLRKRLISQSKSMIDPTLKSRIKNLNYEIKSHFTSQKRNKVRKGIVPGNSKTLQ